MTRLTDAQEQWANALENGGYEHCRVSLKRGNKYCAIGVGCDTLAPTQWFRMTLFNMHGDPYGDFSNAFAPKQIQDQLQLASRSGEFFHDERTIAAIHESMPQGFTKAMQRMMIRRRKPGKKDSITRMSDVGIPFPTIARIIRLQPEGLFIQRTADTKQEQLENSGIATHRAKETWNAVAQETKQREYAAIH